MVSLKLSVTFKGRPKSFIALGVSSHWAPAHLLSFLRVSHSSPQLGDLTLKDPSLLFSHSSDLNLKDFFFFFFFGLVSPALL